MPLPRGMPSNALRLLISLALVWSLLSSIAHLVAIRSQVASVDFFFYLCCARDLLYYPGAAADDAYRYFPGVYTFWRTAMVLVGQSLLRLQTIYVIAVAVNAMLVAGIVFRLAGGRSRGLPASWAAAFGGLWYLVLASKFDGFFGIVEPLATLPVLCGLAVWNGQPLQARRGILAVLLLGLGLGLALYTKQQAGLLAAGAASLLVNRWGAAPGRRHEWLPLVLLPIWTALVCGLTILCEGRGWLPLQRGLAMVAQYDREDWIGWNLYVQIRNDELAALIGLAAVVIWLVMVIGRHRRLWLGQPWFEMVGFSVLAMLASLWQFHSRPYHHYALLGIPHLVLAAVLLAVHGKQWLPSADRHRRVARWGLLAGCAVVLLFAARHPRAIRVWQWPSAVDVANPRAWHLQADVARDLQTAGRQVTAGSTMYVLPPRQNAPHFLWGTRSVSDFGYWWGATRQRQTQILDRVDWSQYQFVLVITGGLNDIDRRIWDASLADEMTQMLEQRGFRVQFDLKTLRLIRRDESLDP